ncbi:MAG: hypothetical protein NTW74_15305 [Acidobacteria bacterium]|nr:hypothetical protein [Acidobacteriota bacterium]
MNTPICNVLSLALPILAAAFIGELAALVSLWRGERLRWLSWLGVIVNGVLLLPLPYLALTADWS